MTSPEIVVRWIWITWWVSWLLAAFWSDRAAKRPATSRQLLYRLFAIAGYVLLFDAYPHRKPHGIVLWHMSAAMGWAMVAMTIAGFAFTWWARIHLGRLWSSSVGRKSQHHVVDTGPYHLVRHPIYTGIIVSSAATAILFGTLVGWIGFVVLTMGWYIKARLEEEFLRDELGAETYGAYARRVPMLVPFT